MVLKDDPHSNFEDWCRQKTRNNQDSFERACVNELQMIGVDLSNSAFKAIRYESEI